MKSFTTIKCCMKRVNIAPQHYNTSIQWTKAFKRSVQNLKIDKQFQYRAPMLPIQCNGRYQASPPCNISAISRLILTNYAAIEWGRNAFYTLKMLPAVYDFIQQPVHSVLALKIIKIHTCMSNFKLNYSVRISNGFSV